jgi:transposase
LQSRRLQFAFHPSMYAIGEDNTVRVIDVFVDELDLAELGFSGVDPEATDRPSYHPSVLLKLYIYGYLNRVQSSRRLGGTMPGPWTWPHTTNPSDGDRQKPP